MNSKTIPSQLNVALIGCVASTHTALNALLGSGVNIVGVVTKAHSSINSDFYDITPDCKQYNIPYFHWTKENNKAFHDFLSSKKPDILFCIGWSHILPKDILAIPFLGSIGFHPAPLPIGRGRHPIIWTLALGLTETASCLFFMNESTDSGDIISKKIISVYGADTSCTLLNKILFSLKHQIAELIPQFLNNTVVWEVQEHSQATYWRKRTELDGKIDFRMTSTAIYNLIRALAPPYPMAFYVKSGEKVFVATSRKGPIIPQHIEPGKILSVAHDEILVSCGEGSLYLERNSKHNYNMNEYIV